MDWVPPCPDLSCLKRRIVIRICPQMAEDATGRCGGPRGDDYLSALPADKSNISICPTSAHNLYIPLYIVKHQTFLYPWDLCGTSLTHSPSLLITSTFFFAKILAFIVVSRSLSFHSPLRILISLEREIPHGHLGIKIYQDLKIRIIFCFLI